MYVWMYINIVGLRFNAHFGLTPNPDFHTRILYESICI